eukprot:CAMPEP_0119504038 /NCGR_PEP_ID=MMETSP1344-20130328/25012_1 /TAXON_ID=236787 /ORGANISM="Florenciella parvula, Strain CCMP2471" /LENGTH=36 /DNA_ID= /DNA_START= /DNA_END= /DNA_ORIENTATION=
MSMNTSRVPASRSERFSSGEKPAWRVLTDMKPASRS